MSSQDMDIDCLLKANRDNAPLQTYRDTQTESPLSLIPPETVDEITRNLTDTALVRFMATCKRYRIHAIVSGEYPARQRRGQSLNTEEALSGTSNAEYSELASELTYVHQSKFGTTAGDEEAKVIAAALFSPKLRSAHLTLDAEYYGTDNNPALHDWTRYILPRKVLQEITNLNKPLCRQLDIITLMTGSDGTAFGLFPRMIPFIRKGSKWEGSHKCKTLVLRDTGNNMLRPHSSDLTSLEGPIGIERVVSVFAPDPGNETFRFAAPASHSIDPTQLQSSPAWHWETLIDRIALIALDIHDADGSTYFVVANHLDPHSFGLPDDTPHEEILKSLKTGVRARLDEYEGPNEPPISAPIFWTDEEAKAEGVLV